MSRFIFDLSDENRAKLEQHRVAWGLRSLSAAAQHLIETKADVPFAPEEVGRIMREIAKRPETKAHLAKVAENVAAMSKPAVPYGSRAFKPHPKPGKKK